MRTIDDMIRDAGWWHGTMREWQSLDTLSQETAAYAATRCLYASPAWDMPVNCSHTRCKIQRGEIPPIAALNRQLLHEIHDGWFRFAVATPDGRKAVAQLCRALRTAARDTGIYDIWKLGHWEIVTTGIAF